MSQDELKAKDAEDAEDAEDEAQDEGQPEVVKAPEPIDLIVIVGDPEDDKSPMYIAPPPTMGIIKKWLRLDQEIKEYQAETGESYYDKDDGLDSLFGMVVDMINHEDFTVENFDDVQLDFFLVMFSQNRITTWVNQHVLIPKKRQQELLELTRMRAKKAKKRRIK